LFIVSSFLLMFCLCFVPQFCFVSPLALAVSVLRQYSGFAVEFFF